MRQRCDTTQKASDQDREHLIHDIFHDLNQPLTALHCCIELCINDANLAQKRRRDLRLALREINTVCDLTEKLERAVEALNRARAKSSRSRREPAVPLALLSRSCG